MNRVNVIIEFKLSEHIISWVPSFFRQVKMDDETLNRMSRFIFLV